MGRLVDVEDLVTAQQIADRFGVAQVQTVYNWERRYPAFPLPAWKIGRWRLWLWSEVEAWGRVTDRLPSGS